MEVITIFRKKKPLFPEKLTEYPSQNSKENITTRIKILEKLEKIGKDEKPSNLESLTKRIEILKKINNLIPEEISEKEDLKEIKNYKEDILENVIKTVNLIEKEKSTESTSVTESIIRKLFDKEFPKEKPLPYIQRYTKEREYKILPDIMETEYEDIPDENGLSKFEILESIRLYSQRIEDLKNKEKNLFSKLDCVLYAEQYLDAIDEVASLYRKKLFPKNVIDYFENRFAYGINLMNWYFKFVLKKTKEDVIWERLSRLENQIEKKVIKKEEAIDVLNDIKESKNRIKIQVKQEIIKKRNKTSNYQLTKEDNKQVEKEFRKKLQEDLIFDPEEKITQIELESEEDRWIDFRWICRGGDSREHQITGFNLTDEEIKKKFKGSQGLATLPDSMYNYKELPEEEGIKPDEVLEIMREYSDSLSRITREETKLDTQVECAVYAERYLDILDQIAYLINNKSLVTDSSTFFENNFSYGLSLKIWYDLKVVGSQGQVGRWDAFLKYCDEFEDDYYNHPILKAFNIEDVLPASMLYYDSLPIDSLDTVDSVIYQKNSKGVLTNFPKIYKKWQIYYDAWVKKQEKISWKNRESIQEAINKFRKKNKIKR